MRCYYRAYVASARDGLVVDGGCGVVAGRNVPSAQDGLVVGGFWRGGRERWLTSIIDGELQVGSGRERRGARKGGGMGGAVDLLGGWVVAPSWLSTKLVRATY